jgi:hypothetical protein
MQLALECLRLYPRAAHRDDAFIAIDMAADALGLGTGICDDIRDASTAARRGNGFTARPRIVRARLALALRVLLRADAGDFGALECDCGEPRETLTYVGHSMAWCNECRTWTDLVAPVRPLWESAPPHEVSR